MGAGNSESNELEEVSEERDLVHHVNGGSKCNLSNGDRDEDDDNGGLLGISGLLPDVLRREREVNWCQTE